MTALVTEWRWLGPRRGADRAVLLAHGAGGDMDSPALARFAEGFADAGIPSLRFRYPYRSAGKKAPDRPPVLDAATRAAASELARRSRLAPERLVLGGRSMGGRYCSLVAGDRQDPVPALGLLLCSYPLHAPGRPDKPRSDHFKRLTMPCCFVSGDRDQMAQWKLLRQHLRKVKGPLTVHKVPTGDHSLRPLRREGYTFDGVLDDAVAAAVAFVEQL